LLRADSILRNRYKIHEQLGQGGMGTVYLATDMSLDRFVAVKNTLVTTPALLEAFDREGKLLSKLRHPSLPVVIDYFPEQESYCIVMDYIKGDSLATVLKRTRTPLALDKVLKLGNELLQVLDYLHTNTPQILHRDIKPDNLKISANGRLMLLDFGLAKASTTGQTQSVAGFTPQYAPLEQIQSTGTDPRSDLFSSGATLYHLMTGVQPPSALDRADAILNGSVDPLRPANKLNPIIPENLSHVLARALDLDPNKRPRSAHEMLESFTGVPAVASASRHIVQTPTVHQTSTRTVLDAISIQEKRSGYPDFKRKVYILCGLLIFGLLTWTAVKDVPRILLRRTYTPSQDSVGIFTRFDTPDHVDGEGKLPVIGTIKVRARIGKMLPSADDRYLYLVDETNNKILKLNMKERQIEDAFHARHEIHTFSISPDGNWIYLCSSPIKRNFETTRQLRLETIQIIDAKTMKENRAFTIPFDSFDMESADNQLFYLTGYESSGGAVVSINAMSIVSRIIVIPPRATITRMPNSSRIYMSGVNEIWTVTPPYERKDQADFSARIGSANSTEGRLKISPDGSVAISNSGAVFRLASSAGDGDLEIITTIPKLEDATFCLDQSRALTAGKDFFSVFSYPDFEEIETLSIPRMIYKMYWHEASKTLFAAVDQRTDDHEAKQRQGNIWLLKLDELFHSE